MIFAVSNVKASLSVEVYCRDEAFYENNNTKPRFYVKNTGIETITSFLVYYYFTVENSKTPVLEDFYTPNSTPSLENLGNDDYRVKFDFSYVNISPGSIIPTGGNSWQLHYSDWSYWDKTNDHSYPNSSSFVENQNMVVYVAGVKIYGNAPSITPPNTAPTDILLSNTEIEENAGPNAIVGTLSAVDAEGGDMTYALVAGYGDTDNGQFNIYGNILRATDDLDYEQGATRSVRIQVADSCDSTFEKAFTITVIDIADYAYPEDCGPGDSMQVDGKTLLNPINGNLDSSKVAEIFGYKNTGTYMNELHIISPGGIYIANNESGTLNQLKFDNQGLRLPYDSSIIESRFMQCDVLSANDWINTNKLTTVDLIADNIASSLINTSHLIADTIESASDSVGLQFSGDTKIDGELWARKITVTLDPFPDYVFSKFYKLKSLKETEEYIKTNGHLPNIPTEQDVKENGVDLGEMQVKIIEKIEEITLYIIELEKRNNALEKEINVLKKQICDK